MRWIAFAIGCTAAPGVQAAVSAPGDTAEGTTTVTTTVTTNGVPTRFCEWSNEPTIPYAWDPDCLVEGLDHLGCLADGKNRECRLCGAEGFAPCPTCSFVAEPITPYAWDNRCKPGEYSKGCFADGVHFECRWCGDEEALYDPCPTTTTATTTATATTMTTTTSEKQQAPPVPTPTPSPAPSSSKKSSFLDMRESETDAASPSRGHYWPMTLAPVLLAAGQSPGCRARGGAIGAILLIAAAVLVLGPHRRPASLTVTARASGIVKAFDAGSVSDGRFATNAATVKSFEWGPPQSTAAAAAELAFPNGAGWQNVAFAEGTGGSWTLQSVVKWVDDELLGGPDPFASEGAGAVPLPYTAPNSQGGKFPTPRDQLEPGQWVAYSRRQVCFIVAKSLIGSATTGYENGLLRFMHKRVGGPAGCTAAGGDFGRAWWTLLASCAADPNLASGAQGPVLIAAKALDEPPMDDLRKQADDVQLSAAGLRTCSYDDGTGGALADVPRVPSAGCRPPSAHGPGADFMTGGLKGQATQDISAMFLGGYIYGNTCSLGGGQDERLMVYYPEVSALTFFLSEAGPDGVYGPPQLRQPAWILGARRVRIGVDGTCLFENQFQMDPDVPLTSDLVDVPLDGHTFKMSGSKPFLAFMTENQGFLGWPESAAELSMARRNKEPRQRDVDPNSKMSFEKQVRAWYRAVALTSYDKAVQPALMAAVTSVGVGPWGAGLWWGDSQVSLLASWIGHAMAAKTWGVPLPLDYYVYSAFTENPGNQCLVYSSGRCKACLDRCERVSAGQQHAYWLPGEAYRHPGSPDPCAADAADCGEHGLEDVVRSFSDGTAASLWQALEQRLAAERNAPVTRTVFDLLLDGQRQAVA